MKFEVLILMISWDESLFKNIEVFDPEYVPDEILFRNSQISQLVACLKPAVRGASPVNALCVGPPSTGKTSTIKYVIKESSEYFKICYIRCPRFKDPYKIFAKIFETVFNQQPPPTGGVSKVVLMDKVWNKLDEPLAVVLDDINFLSKKYADEVLYEILKAADEYSVKVGVITVATDVKFPLTLDPFVSSIFHYVEILYPSYSYLELREILKKRVELGFYPEVFEEDAFEKVVELSHKAGDVRYGIYLLKTAGILAESRGSRKISVEDVEKAHIGESLTFASKIVSTLNSEERAILRMIYSRDEISTGELYKMIREEVNISYRKYYYILEKLERLKLIDVAFGNKRKGKTRFVYRRYAREIIERALMGM